MKFCILCSCILMHLGSSHCIDCAFAWLERIFHGINFHYLWKNFLLQIHVSHLWLSVPILWILIIITGLVVKGWCVYCWLDDGWVECCSVLNRPLSRRLAGGHRDGIITSAPAAEHKMGDVTATARCCALPPLLLLMSSLLDTSRC